MESSLELFLLALIDSGLSTPYEFHSQAGISVGASLPALKKLLQQRLVSRGKAADRHRMQYSLTAGGRVALKKAKLSRIDAPADVASGLRLAVLSNYLGSRLNASDILNKVQSKIVTDGEPESMPKLTSLALAYRWMLAVREHHRNKGDVDALREIVRTLNRRSR